MVIGKVLGVFIMVLIGYGANKIGWLPVESSKYLSKIVINIAAPCVVIHSMSTQNLNNETVSTMLLIFGITFTIYIVSWLFSMLVCKILKIPEADKGVYKNFIIFTNNAFMGFPIAYALFGSEGMFLMVLAGIMMPLFTYTVGVGNLMGPNKKKGSRLEIVKARIKEIINAPIISTFVGLGILLLRIPVPETIEEVLSAVGAMMAPLCMIVIGIQLTESSPLKVMTNHKLIIISFLRLLFIPGIVFTVLYLAKMDSLLICIMTLNVMMPCAAVPVALAEEYGSNVKLAAEGTFLSTLFSMATIPIAGVLLTLYVL